MGLGSRGLGFRGMRGMGFRGLGCRGLGLFWAVKLKSWCLGLIGLGGSGLEVAIWGLGSFFVCCMEHSLVGGWLGLFSRVGVGQL